MRLWAYLACGPPADELLLLLNTIRRLQPRQQDQHHWKLIALLFSESLFAVSLRLPDTEVDELAFRTVLSGLLLVFCMCVV